jgi:hypothetical protein
MPVTATWVVATCVCAVAVLALLVARAMRGQGRSVCVASFTTAAPPEHVLAALAQGAESIPHASVLGRTRTRLEASVGASRASWGEVIEAEVRPPAPPSDGVTAVVVESRSKLGSTLLDWGKNQRNVDALLEAVDRLDEPRTSR